MYKIWPKNKKAKKPKFGTFEVFKVFLNLKNLGFSEPFFSPDMDTYAT